MRTTFSRFTCALLAAATLAVSAATEPTLAAPPVPDEALEEAAAAYLARARVLGVSPDAALEAVRRAART